MQSRQLRLVEFAPTRTMFNQILADTTIKMGFECEMITDTETQVNVSREEVPDYDRMSWDNCEREVSIGTRTRNSINEEYTDWLFSRSEKWLNKKWYNEEDEYTLKWCQDNAYINTKHDLENQKSDFYEAALIALHKLGYKAEKADNNAPDDKIVLFVHGVLSEDDVTRLNALLADEQEEAYGEIAIQHSHDGSTELTGQVGVEQDVDEIVDSYRSKAHDDFNDEFRDEAEEENDGDMDDFIEAEYHGSNIRLMDAFNIEYESDSDEEETEDADVSTVYYNMAKNLKHIIGHHVGINVDDKVTDKHPDNWYIEEDGSLEGDGYVTAEVVSSVYTLIDGLDALQTIFAWMKANYYTTNTSTGLHVSFSIEGFDSPDEYDFLKMMVLFDENYTANIFDRLGEHYAQQMRNVLFANFANMPDPVAAMSSRQIADTIVKLHSITKNMNFDGGSLGHSKYFTFRHRSDGVVEFRSMGGENYETRFDIIRKRIVNMAYLMKVGSDPSVMARDYIKRIYKMLTSTKYQKTALGSGQGRGIQSPNNLSAFQTIFDRDPHLSDFIAEHPALFLLRLAEKIKAKSVILSPLQIRQLRFFIARQKIDADTMRSVTQNDSLYNVLANLMRWPLVVPGHYDPDQEILPFVTHGEDFSGTPPAEDPDADPSTAFNRFRLRQDQYGLGGDTSRRSVRNPLS